jgi:hypothetical protein
MASGQVSYSYLRYNFISGSGRTGSFFGMSVVFSKEYCYDVENLYKLFDTVYKTILKNKLLLEEVKANPDVQANYLVRTFSEAEAEVKRIENIICKNIENKFAADIRPLDNTFAQGNSNLIVKLNNKKGNATFLKALRECSWVSISPEYKDNEKSILSPEKIAWVDETIEEVQKNFGNISVNAVKGADVQKDIEIALEKIQNGKNTIKPYLQIQHELQERDSKLLVFEKQFKELNDVVLQNNKTGIGNQHPPININSGDNSEKHNEKGTKSPTIPFWKKYKLPFIAVACVVILGSVAYFTVSNLGSGVNTPPKETNKEDNTAKQIEQGNALLKNKDYRGAYDKFMQAGNTVLADKAKNDAYTNLPVRINDLVNNKNYTEAEKQCEVLSYLGYSNVTEIENVIAEAKMPLQPPRNPLDLPKPPPEPSGSSTNTAKESQVLIRTYTMKGTAVSGSEYSISEKLTIKAIQNNDLCTNGVWTFENNNIAISDTKNNPTTIQMYKAGTCKLYYKVDGVEKACIHLKIKKLESNI